jgi:hypothetical protein
MHPFIQSGRGGALWLSLGTILIQFFFVFPFSRLTIIPFHSIGQKLRWTMSMTLIATIDTVKTASRHCL